MLKELVEYLYDTGKDAGEYQVVQHPTNPDKRLVIGPDGVKELDTPRQLPPGADSCFSVGDFSKRLATNLDTYSKTIWYDESSGTSYSTDEFRIRSVSVAFPPHPILRSVQKLASQQMYDQKQILKFLRIDLAGLVDDFVIARFRSLNWESAKRARQVIAHGKASLDAEVRSSVTTDDGEVPEAFVVNAPLFADSAYRNLTFPARVAVELDTDNLRMGLVLMPGVVDEILSAQRQSVERFLSDALGDDYELICGKSIINCKS